MMMMMMIWTLTRGWRWPSSIGWRIIRGIHSSYTNNFTYKTIISSLFVVVVVVALLEA
jgi:hypothetical protein